MDSVTNLDDVIPQHRPVHHLATSFLVADSINHGIMLEKNATLQLLYYYSQIGLGLCPISNSLLFCHLKDSPVSGAR